MPDSNTKLVQFCGNIKLHEKMVLKNVLYIPSFKHNLLLVSKLTKYINLKLMFFSIFCLLQDQRTDDTVVVGKENKHLYFLDRNSFSSEVIKAGCNLVSKSRRAIENFSANNVDVSLWHKRMGHPSAYVLQHLPFSTNDNKDPFEPCDVCKTDQTTFFP